METETAPEQQGNPERGLVHGGQYELANMGHVMKFANELKRFIQHSGLSTKIGYGRSAQDYANVDGWKFAGTAFGLVALPDEPVALHQPGELLWVLFKNEVQADGNGVPYLDGTGKPKRKWVPFRTTTVEAYANKLEAKYCTPPPPAEPADPNAATAPEPEKYEMVIRQLFKYKCRTQLIHVATGRVVGYGDGVCSNAELKKQDFDEYAVASMAQTRSIGKAYRNLIGYVMKAAGFEPTPAEEMDGEQYQKNPEAPAAPTAGEPLPETVVNQFALFVDYDEAVRYYAGLPEYHGHKQFEELMVKTRARLRKTTK